MCCLQVLEADPHNPLHVSLFFPLVGRLMEPHGQHVNRLAARGGGRGSRAAPHRPRWLRPDWSLESMNLTWVSNYCDWSDALDSFMSLLGHLSKRIRR